MNKNLLVGLPALIIGAILAVLLPELGVTADLGPIMDGELTWGDLLTIVGNILIGVAAIAIPSSAPVVAEMRKTTIGFKVFGAPRINGGGPSIRGDRYS